MDMASADAGTIVDANMSEMPDMGTPPLNFVNHCCGTEESDWTRAVFPTSTTRIGMPTGIRVR